MKPPRRSTQDTHPEYEWAGGRLSTFGYRRRKTPKPFAHLSGRQRAKARKAMRRQRLPIHHWLRLKIRRALVEWAPGGMELRKQGL